ncbi:tRNA (N6-isopentenyl adenosine(37)-C2)-methylthiotransferase MiaB [Devosia sp. WQ 349]|uniref:tRNA (N6-isopentenyl adenosine(37)-C2)-methylthiotransferase MiaB n=1 Tax=Devosia sp. WQ 349K1 TaxID=2800329 RepID=UPI001904D60D|nr:tRNA (N6-isopentenyl adenosine(37)-C2)-methylthiotransferase MiaB [Devosia sp. WQ 349K1]MBK1795153.1 tRNA (N6-isopentenyl adenosine(37)-C2)-methylthiotransferase MiaB [Devosia sp. WQ 349K1]
MTQTMIPSAPRRVFIKTYGCQMNVYDSDRMADALAPHGYMPTQELAEADLVLLNTCHIREKASEKVFSELGRLRELQDEKRAAGSDMMIGVAGCVAQAEGEEIARRAPVVDLVFGPQAYHRLPEMLSQVESRKHLHPSLKRAVIDTDFPEEDKFAHLPAAKKEVMVARGLTAFLTVQEGCDKFCSFCVVPYTRGAEVSRPVSQVLDEARRLVDAGVKEITLLGQNVNAYHGTDAAGRDVGLGALVYLLAEISGLERLRYTTSHPRDMDDALINAHRDLPLLMPYLHLPVQSGSDRILKAMNRKHTRAEYLALIERIKTARPDMAMSGDFIVGFPGETDQDFEDTLDIIRQTNYASAYSFKYSTRPGTPGANLGDQIAEEVKTERLHRLQELVNQQTTDFHASMIGKTLPVLIERVGRQAGQIGGRSPYLQAVHLDGSPDLIGNIHQVEIIGTMTNSLVGRLAQI